MKSTNGTTTGSDPPLPKAKVVIAQYPTGTIEVMASGRVTIRNIVLPDDRERWPLWARGPLHRSWRTVFSFLPQGNPLCEQREAETRVFKQFERANEIFPGLLADKQNRIGLMKLALITGQPIDQAAETLKLLAMQQPEPIEVPA